MFYQYEARWLAVRGPASVWTSAWNPEAVTLRRRDTPEAAVYTLRAPGYRRRDLDVEVRDRMVTITGARARGFLKPTEVRFTRSFSLPPELDPRDVRASFADGVLSLTIAKKPEARVRRVAVRVLDAGGESSRPADHDARTEKDSWWGRARAWLRARVG